jgi:hypothetical protein
MPSYVVAAFQNVFFITYLYVNFDRFSAKQIAIDRYEKEHPQHKVKMTADMRKKLIKRYVLTFLFFFVVLLLFNLYNYYNVKK